MSEKILAPDDKAKLAAEYEKVNGEFGRAEQLRLEAMAEALLKKHEHADS